MKYTIPVDGYYQVGAQVVYYEKTGETETVLNESRKWYQFWKPKNITQDKYRRLYKTEGTKTQFYKQGEQIDLSAAVAIRRSV